MITSIQAGTSLYLPVSETPVYQDLWYIKPDGFDMERSGVPMTCQFRPEISGKFTVAMQRAVFNLNRSDNEARDRAAFQGYRDTWNTRGKVRDNYNAITGEGDPNSLPTVEYNIGIAGNVIRGVPDVSDGTYGIVRGTPVLRILDWVNPNNIPTLSFATHPHLVHHLIIVRGNTYEGQKVRNPFPQMGGRDVAPYLPSYTLFWYPVQPYIELAKVVKVSTVPNIYNPHWSPYGG